MSGGVRTYPVTLAVLGLLGTVYAGQLLLAGSLDSGAAYGMANDLSSRSYLLFNPWIHSTHNHLLQNTIFFSILGWWTEQRINSLHFWIVVMATGYLTNLAPAMLGLGGFGIGASGITNALWAHFTAVQLSAYQKAVQKRNVEVRRVVGRLFFFFIGLVFVLKSAAEYFGYVTPPVGAATGAHLLGILIGFGWFTYRWLR
jgi:membrane associated rhomboid family serine protease